MKLALCDMDGTLFDTKQVNFLAYREAFARCGCAVEEERFRASFFGRRFSEFLPEFLPDATPALIERIHETKKELYAGYLGAARENAALLALLDGLRGRIPAAVVTTASRRNAEELLRHFGRLGDFALVVAQEDVRNVKPDPEAFLRAMERFGASPAETMIFEDSEAGIRCAKQLGAAVFRVEQF